MSDYHLPRIAPLSSSSLRAAQELARAEVLEQIDSAEDLQSWMENSFNPVAMMRNFRTLNEQKSTEQTRKGERKSDVDEELILKVEALFEIADHVEKHNYELQAKTLLILRGRITSSDSEEDILKKVLEVYPDHALADEALDFLIQTSRGSLQDTTRRAKELFNQQFSREILAGRNIGAQAREFSQQGLGSPTSLRDLYREITGNPREPLKLFEELANLFPYEKLKTTIQFLLHSLGADLKSKGPSIDRGELKMLLDETRSLQGILGVFRFFQSRMPLIARQFLSYDVPMPAHINFETLAKQFIKLLSERYVNADKVLQSARFLGVSEKTIVQIIVFTQMRDALRQIALRYYRNPQHFQELMKAMIEALEKLEDEWEEEEEEEEK
ncbi:MAG: hypothetical protein IT584_03060 [Chlamydiae bacterium]|nr:hypothetical protein [Chlamydiota bacterium]